MENYFYLSDNGTKVFLSTTHWKNIDERPQLIALIYSKYVIEQLVEITKKAYYDFNDPLISDESYNILRMSLNK